MIPILSFVVLIFPMARLARTVDWWPFASRYAAWTGFVEMSPWG